MEVVVLVVLVSLILGRDEITLASTQNFRISLKIFS